MSANESPFAIDAPAVSRALRSYVENRGPVMAYVDAIHGVDLGTHHYDVAGMSGDFDPFHDQRTAADALAIVKGHTMPVRSAVESLHELARQPKVAIATLTDPLKKLQALLESIGPTGTLSDAQAVEARTQLYLSAFFTKGVAGGYSHINRDVNAFLDVLASDYNALSAGVISVGTIRTTLVAYTQSESGKYIFNPVTRPIGEMIARLGGVIVQQLDTLGGSVVNALVGHQEMRSGLSALATATDAAATKVENLEKKLARLDNAKLSVEMRLTRIEDAIESWDEYADFLQKSGL